MKTIVLYYSYSGKTKKLAVQKANELNADIEEITEIKKPGKLKAFFVGVFHALKRKRAKINPVKSELSNYDKIIAMSPVWAGHPAPAFNSIIRHLPSGKKIEIIMVSAGGGTKDSAEKTKEIITARGCEVVDYTDITA